jgi:outer membrane protein
MTNKRLGILSIAVLLLWLLVVADLAAADLKIGFVNAARVLEEAPQAEKARKQLEKEFAPRDKQLLGLQKTIKKLDEKLSRDGAIMSENEQRKLDREIVTNKRELKRSREEFREDLNIRRNEAFEKLSRRIREVITFIAEKEKYDLIVGDSVIFASKRIDISNKVVQQLKQEMKTGKKAKAAKTNK